MITEFYKKALPSNGVYCVTAIDPATKIPRHKKWGYRSSSSALKWLTIHEFDNLEASKNKVLDLVSIAKVLKSKNEYNKRY